MGAAELLRYRADFLQGKVPKLLADPAYQRVYTKNNLLPGFIPNAEYVKFMNDFGAETAGFLKESGVIR